MQVCVFVDCESARGEADELAALRMKTGLGQKAYGAALYLYTV